MDYVYCSLLSKEFQPNTRQVHFRSSGVFISRTVLTYSHDGIYIWALGSNTFELKTNKLFCNHELYICFENINDNWLEDSIKSEGAHKSLLF